MTIKRTIKKTVRKSTSSHTSKVAQKSVTRVTKKLPLELQKNYYSEKTLAEVLAVGTGYLKAHLQFEKKTTSQKVTLVKLSLDMVNEAKKNKLILDRKRLQNAIYHFTGYKTELNNKNFMMSIKRVIDATFYLMENSKASISDAGQILDSKGKVVPVIDLDKKSSSKPSRNRDNKKNEVTTLSKAKESLQYLINNPQFLQNLDLEDLTDFQNTLEIVVNQRTVENDEDPNPQMKGIGTMPEDIDFTNKSARI